VRFAHAELLWLLVLLPVLGAFALWRLNAGRRALSRALGPVMAGRLTARLVPRAREARLALALLALGFLILGGARPQRGTQYVTAKRVGGDVVFALDVSESMLAEDLKPNRLQRARHEISAILDRLKGDRVGLVAFSGEAFLQCPLTMDYSAARMFLDYMTPALIPQPGTNLGAALHTAVRAFAGEGEGVRAVVLITDGEDHEGDIEAATREARAANVRVFAVGIGSAAGEPIPVRDESGAIRGYKKDRAGTVVLSRLQEGVLRDIADATGGIYVEAGGTLGLHRILDAIEGIEKRELEGGVRVLYEERYRYFVWPALLLLLLEAAVPSRRGAGRALLARVGRRRTPGAAAACLALALCAWGGAFPGFARAETRPASPPVARNSGAEEARPEEEWRKLFEENEVFRSRHPDDARPAYNLGNLLHERGDWKEAESCYHDAAALAEGRLQANALYNLGNTLFRKQELKAARDAFVETLRADPSNEEAKRNLELTQWLLDQVSAMPDSSQQQDQGRQEDQQQQQQQDPQQRDQQQDQEQQQRDQQQQGQQSQQKQEQSQQQQGQQQQQQEEQQREQQQERERQDQEQQQNGEELPPEAQQAAEADSTRSLEGIQARQLLRGLEGRERELLEQRFQARSRRLNVEKDW